MQAVTTMPHFHVALTARYTAAASSCCSSPLDLAWAADVAVGGVTLLAAGSNDSEDGGVVLRPQVKRLSRT